MDAEFGSRGVSLPDDSQSASGWMATEPGTLSMRAPRASSVTLQQQQLASNLLSATSSPSPTAASSPLMPPFPTNGSVASLQPRESASEAHHHHHHHHHHSSDSKDIGATASMRSKKHKRMGSTGLLSVGRSTGVGAREHAAQTTQKVLQLAMDPSMPDVLTKPVKPWLPLIVILVILGLQVASAVMSAPGSEEDDERGNTGSKFDDSKDAFTAAGWATHYGGIVCLVASGLLVLLRRRPLHTEPSVLLLSFLALVLLIAAAVLHTARLNVSATSLVSGSTEAGTPVKHVRAAQLGWIANVLLYICMAVIVYFSPRPSFNKPSSSEEDKLDALSTVRDAESMRRRVVQALTDREAEVQAEEQVRRNEQTAQLQAYEARKMAARAEQQQMQTPLILSSDPTSPNGAALLFSDVEPNTPLPISQPVSAGLPFTPASAAVSSQRARVIVSRGDD